MRKAAAPHVMRRADGKLSKAPSPTRIRYVIHPCRVEPLLVEPALLWSKKRSTSAPASELQRHQPQMKSADVTTMVAAAIVVVGIAGRCLLLGKEQLAKPFPPSLWSVIATS